MNRWIIGLFLGFVGLLAVASSLPEVQSDWQLPYVVDDGVVIHADTRGTWVRYPNGAKRQLLGDGRGFPPVVTDDRIYATNINGGLLAWDRVRREVLWRRQFEGWVFPPLVTDKSLLLGGQMHRLYQLDAATGKNEDSVALSNEAIFKPVAWQDGQLAVGVYSRYWQVIERDPLRLAERIDVPEPPKTATPNGRFLTQSGSLYQRNADDSFTRLVAGNSPVRWLDNRAGQLYWSTGRQVWRNDASGLGCLAATAEITHLGATESGYRLQILDIYGTLTTVPLSQDWGFPLFSQDKEKNDEKNVNRPDRDTGHQLDDVGQCRTLRHQ